METTDPWLIFRQTLPGFMQALSPVMTDAPNLFVEDTPRSKAFRDAVFAIACARHGAFQRIRNSPDVDVMPMNEAIKIFVRCAEMRARSTERSLRFLKKPSQRRLCYPIYRLGSDHSPANDQRSLWGSISPTPRVKRHNHIRFVNTAYRRLNRQQAQGPSKVVYVWDAVANFFSIALPNATIEVNDLDVELTRELVHDHTPEEIRIAARVLAVLIRTAVRGRR